MASRIDDKVGKQLIEMGPQFGMKLQRDVLPKQTAERQTGNDDGHRDPAPGPEQQAQAEGVSTL